MATPTLDSRLHMAVAEYGVFWQSWPHFEVTNGEHRLAGIELELMGTHASGINHVDPACVACHDVRSVLLKIATRMLTETFLRRDRLRCELDTHWNSILCLPALGNRSVVWVSVYIYSTGANNQAADTDLLTEIKTSLDRWGIHRR